MSDLDTKLRNRLNLVRKDMQDHHDEIDDCVSPLFNDASELGGAVQAVLDMHKPFGVYTEECGHDHEYNEDGSLPEGVLDINDVGLVCQDGLMYRVCTHCCLDGWDEQREHCANDHDHHYQGVYCPTVAVMAEGMGIEPEPVPQAERSDPKGEQ
jgi:hypothetical protein